MQTGALLEDRLVVERLIRSRQEPGLLPGQPAPPLELEAPRELPAHAISRTLNDLARAFLVPWYPKGRSLKVLLRPLGNEERGKSVLNPRHSLLRYCERVTGLRV